MLAGHIGNYSRYEIERKFLLKCLPDTVLSHYVDIEDTYLPDSSLRLRIEKASSGEIIGRKLTKKDKDATKGFTTSIITSLYLTERDLSALGSLNGAKLNKRRYIQEGDSNRIVFDVFSGPFEGLILAEIEFLDAESCSKFVSDDTSWIEVTGNPEYSGGNLALSALVKNK